ncbi:MAG: hypothetical protein V4529_16580 [Gemmatimonadota bacterium]
MSGPAEQAASEIARLEIELEECDPEEREDIVRAIRDIERDEADRERWEQDGEERGWR